MSAETKDARALIDLAISSYARKQQRGRIAGDDQILYDYYKYITPAYVLVLFDDLTAAQAELAALRKDAGRLDFVDSKHCTLYHSNGVHWVYVDESAKLRKGIVEPTLRGTIDAAIAATKG